MLSKKILQIFLAAMIVVAGCQTIELSPSMMDIDNCTSSLSVSTKVTPAHIDAYLNGYKGIPKTRSADVSVAPILNGIDTVMYLVNYPEGGWEVLSADTRVPKVLVMCEGGSMTVDELASNPAEEDLYGAMGDYISYLHDNPDLEVADSLGNWSDVAHQTENIQTREIESWVLIGTSVLEEIIEEQDHLTQTRWRQGSASYPITMNGWWNSRAPYIDSDKTAHCLNGCVPVAICQMLYYLHYKIGVPTHFYSDCSTELYIPDGQHSVTILPEDVTLGGYSDSLWNRLPLQLFPQIHTKDSLVPLASMMLHVGSLVEATYKFYPDSLTALDSTKVTGTSAHMTDVPDAFSSFNIDCNGPHCYNPNFLYSEICTNEMPIMVSIARYDTQNNRHGHAVIFDGYHCCYRSLEKRYVWNSISGPQYKTTIEDETIEKIAINWGWGTSGMVDSSGATIWYNKEIVNWNNYTEIEQMIYGFSTL